MKDRLHAMTVALCFYRIPARGMGIRAMPCPSRLVIADMPPIVMGSRGCVSCHAHRAHPRANGANVVYARLS